MQSALTVVAETMSMVLVRLGVRLGFSVFTLLWLGVSMVLCQALALRVDVPELRYLGLIVGFGVPWGLFRWYQACVLSPLRYGHLVLLTRLASHGSIENESTVRYGQQQVLQRFGDLGFLEALRTTARDAVHKFNEEVGWFEEFFPIPRIPVVSDFVYRVLSQATWYVADAIVSYDLARNDQNKWRSTKDAVIYYGQNWRSIYRSALNSFVFDCFVTAGLILVCFGPAAVLAMIMPEAVGGAVYVFAVLFAFDIRAAVLRPFFETGVLLAFHNAIREQPINAELEETLESKDGLLDAIWAGMTSVGEVPTSAPKGVPPQFHT